MRGLALVAVILLVGCTRIPAPAAAVTATASPSAAPSTPAEATPTPATSPTSVSVTSIAQSLSCRLPVTWAVSPGDGLPVGKAGFLSFPSGMLEEDLTAPATTLFYDRAYSQWLSISRTSVSPDGKAYAYTRGSVVTGDTNGSVHRVDVANGADTVIFSGAPIFTIVDFAREGIYLSGSVGEGRSHGLWLLNPAGGAPRLLNGTIVGPVVGDGAAWGFEFNPADKHPSSGALEGPVNQVVRFDLVTGAKTVWFYRPGADLYPAGVDADGHLLVAAYPNSYEVEELWVIKSAGAATMLAAGSSETAPAGVAAVDRHGAWLENPRTTGGRVWLYAGNMLRLVASTDLYGFSVAGGCIP